MTDFKLNKIALTASIIALLVILLAFLSKNSFALLTTAPNILQTHEYWRWLSCNFVHYGWAHCLIDVAAFWLVSVTLLYSLSISRFLTLFLFCCLAVGVCISIVSPEILYYAGLSGSIHGLMIAGCFYATDSIIWKRLLIFIIVLGKIIDEQLPGYDINPVHNLLPVVVAIDAHLIGAIAGLIFVIIDKTLCKLQSLKTS